MRRLGAWGVMAALLLGANAVLAAPDGGNREVPGVKKGPPKPVAGNPSTEVEQAARVRAHEEAKYTRRCEVCDKLKEIAESLGNSALRQRAEALDARAWEVYLQRTAHLPSSQALFESDHKVLEKHLGPVSGSSTMAVPGGSGYAGAKEEQR